MVRSWDARVRGATEKVVAQPEVGLADAWPAEAPANGNAPHELVSEGPVGGVADVSSVTAEYEPVEYPPLDRRVQTVETIDERAKTIEVVIEGLSVAVDAVGLSMAVVDRSGGQILWSSEGWTTRFGVQSQLSRHWPSSTDLGESPLPAKDESWQRNRSMLLVDGTEDIVELLMIGADTSIGDPFVTIVAMEGTPSGPQISDRAEVIGIIEGAIQVAADSRADGGARPDGQYSARVSASRHGVAVLYVDLDRFKVVHDLVGNLEALRLLDLVSRRISSTMRSTDLFFRLPSDEFVVIATDLDRLDAAEELAERVRAAVATLSDLGNDMALTASVGVALAEAGQSGDELLSAAETAVYLAKGRGRNRVAVHDEELRARSQRLLVVERQLRRAIERREVRFAYQPVVEMATGRVAGAEALLRLGGEVGLSAMEVIAAAEHSGLMGSLGSLVLEGVDDQLTELIRSPHDSFEVMVNLSGTQLQDDELLRTLQQLASDPTIAPGRLAVEVPEVVIEENREAFLHLVNLVRPRFKIGIDGFGARMSSTSLLELPVDYVKLHRTVTGASVLVGDGRNRVARLLDAAAVAGVSAIALGVESAEQATVLQQLGCSLAQGFLYVGAVAAPDLFDLIEVGFGEPASPKV